VIVAICEVSARAFGLRVTTAVTRARRALRLLAETVREIGILTVVFAPLESVFGDRRIEGTLLAIVMLVSVAAILCAILVEARD
jgi:hypothetical protein